MLLSDKIKLQRKKNDLSQMDVAKQLHHMLGKYNSHLTWQKNISDYELNRREIHGSVRTALKYIFNVDHLYFEDLHVQLKNLREKRGYTQSEIGNKLGLTGSGYSVYEKPNHCISKKKLMILANLYRKDIDWFTVDYSNKNNCVENTTKEKGDEIMNEDKLSNETKFFIKKLRKLWKDSGLTQKELGEELEINKNTLGHYLSPSSNAIPKGKKLERICDYFNVTENYFYVQANTTTTENERKIDKSIYKELEKKFKQAKEERLYLEAEVEELTNQIVSMQDKINENKNKNIFKRIFGL